MKKDGELSCLVECWAIASPMLFASFGKRAVNFGAGPKLLDFVAAAKNRVCGESFPVLRHLWQGSGEPEGHSLSRLLGTATADA